MGISPAEFAQFYLEHYSELVRYAQKISTSQNPDDLVQDAFTKAWSKRDQCRGNIRPWMYSIVRRRAIDLGRKKIPVPSDRLEAIIESKEGYQDREVEVNEVLNACEELYGSDTVARDWLEGRTMQETGQRLGCVKSNVYRMRSRLKAYLTRHL